MGRNHIVIKVAEVLIDEVFEHLDILVVYQDCFLAFEVNLFVEALHNSLLGIIEFVEKEKNGEAVLALGRTDIESLALSGLDNGFFPKDAIGLLDCLLGYSKRC